MRYGQVELRKMRLSNRLGDLVRSLCFVSAIVEIMRGEWGWLLFLYLFLLFYFVGFYLLLFFHFFFFSFCLFSFFLGYFKFIFY